jgi:hypothetical protein
VGVIIFSSIIGFFIYEEYKKQQLNSMEYQIKLKAQQCLALLPPFLDFDFSENKQCIKELQKMNEQLVRMNLEFEGYSEKEIESELRQFREEREIQSKQTEHDVQTEALWSNLKDECRSSSIVHDDLNYSDCLNAVEKKQDVLLNSWNLCHNKKFYLDMSIEENRNCLNNALRQAGFSLTYELWSTITALP